MNNRKQEFKKVIIISESSEKTTENVIDWLYCNNVEITRKNVDSDCSDFNIQINSKTTSTSLSNNFVWNRRGYLPILPTDLKNTDWIDYLKKEQLPILSSLEKFNNHNYIGSYVKEVNNNKLLNLQEAVNVGLEIPETIVTNNKHDLFQFIKKDKKYITKCLHAPPNLQKEDYFFAGSGTIILDLDNISDNFAPSLVQEYIEKEVEIRVFFVKNEFYSMAIFSQNDKKTQIDFRNYNDDKPNRNVPFLLNNDILNKLKLFTKNIGTDTGSIDLILTPENKFIFLEINPMGQYNWLSEACNYYIDKEIAEILIKKSADV